MISLATLLIIVAVVSILYLFFKKDDKLNFPPGPTSWPLVGNMIQLGSTFHLKLLEWRLQYGDIFTIWMGPKRVIVIMDAKLAREAFNDVNFTGKPDIEAVTFITGGPKGLINSSGKDWEDQRRFTLRHLRDFGFGKNYLESTIMHEVNELLDRLKNLQGVPTDVSRMFSLAVLNSLWQILGSKRYNQDDPKLNHILNTNLKFFETLTKNPLLMLPAFAKSIPRLTGWSTLVKLSETLRQFIRESEQEHRETYNKDAEPRDFVDMYLHEMQNTKDPNSSFYKELGESNLLAVMHDLFGAGSETTSTTLTYTILMLTKHPDVQRKVHEELDKVVGHYRQPSFSDRPDLPYCTAVMDEVLRHHSMVPMGSIRKVLADTKFHGYDLPKGTWLVVSLYWINNNPAHFKDPLQFNPSRFMSADGTKFQKSEFVVPFSMGKRACLGETLARDEFFLFFTSIFQKFEIELAPEFKDINPIPKPSSVLMPPKFKVILKERSTN